jgi:hypothetical protein
MDMGQDSIIQACHDAGAAKQPLFLMLVDVHAAGRLAAVVSSSPLALYACHAIGVQRRMRVWTGLRGPCHGNNGDFWYYIKGLPILWFLETTP